MITQRSDSQGQEGRVPSRTQWLAIILAVIVIDRVTKTLALTYLSDGRVSLIPGYLDGVIFRNAGASRGLLAGHPLVLFALEGSAAVLTVVLAYRFRGGAVGFGFALVAGGGIGNLLDRIIYGGSGTSMLSGRVVDWLSVHGSRTVFNLSDVAIQAGIVTIGIAIVFGWVQRLSHR